MEGEPPSGTERAGGASASRGANRSRPLPAATCRVSASAGAGPTGWEGGDRGGGWRPGGRAWISRRAGGPSVAGMSSGEDDGPGGRGRAPELQVEGTEVRRARGEPLRGGCKRVGRGVGV